MITRRVARFVDDRVGGARWAKNALDKSFPDHFSFMLGEVALYAFVVLLVTGAFLTLFFEPSSRTVVYHGAYVPLDGQRVTAAYRSAIRISYDVRGGLLMRQTHHWAALVFLAAIVAHLGRIFFTGAFRRPREINWLVGSTLLLLALVNGFAGYSLLDDLLSGTGLRIAHALAQSIPVIGEWVASLAFGGQFPGDIIGRLFVLHVLLVPGAILAVVSIHLALVWHQKHTQFAGPGRTEQNLVGSRLWPTYAMKSVALLFAVFAVLVALGGLVQINPVWQYGPYDPAVVTIASQPDWYVGWMEGALRLMPPWEPHALGYQVPNPFFPAILLPGASFLLLFAWPFVERKLSGDDTVHNLLDRPRDRPLRTAFGAAVIGFYGVLFLGGGSDVIARVLRLSVNSIVVGLRIALFAVPVVVGAFTWRVCHDLTGTPVRGPAILARRLLSRMRRALH